jgi:hypothetical protein
VNGGAQPVMLASSQAAPGCIVYDSGNVYWTNLGRLGSDLFPAINSGAVMQVATGGQAQTITIAPSQAIPSGLAVANGNVYWAVYGLSVPGLIVQAPSGGGLATPLVGGLNNPFSLTYGNNALYWTNTPSSNGSGTILSLSPL